MKSWPIILGINSAYHESSACILRGSRPLAIAEEERFNRRKHAKPAEVDNPDEIPAESIRDCLRRAGIRPHQVDYVAYSFDPGLRRPFLEERTTPGSWGTPEGEQTFRDHLGRVPRAVGEVLGEDVRNRWIWVAHELCHAASAYFASPFEDAAVLSVDGIGEYGTGMMAHGHGVKLDVIEEFTYPDSLGFVWEKFAKFIGLDEYAAPKLMALAAFARGGRFDADLEVLVRGTGSGFSIDIDELRFRVEDYGPLEKRFGPRRNPGDRIDFRDAALAASLQKRTEAVLFALAERLKTITRSSNFCMAGGVALNCVAMGRLLNDGPFERIYVQPLANDAGSALGAALWVAYAHAGVSERSPMVDPYLASEFDEASVVAALEHAAVEATRVDHPAAVAAAAIAEGLIVGWFQGPAEVGPRALGARSILGDPRRPGTKELINLKVKHREFFRPFAPAVLEEHAADWFRLDRSSPSTRFMSFAVAVHAERRHLVPAIVHVDGTSRVQTVSASLNPRFHDLITEFNQRTNVPLVLNTSFNTSDEPIVLSPADALATFLRTDLDMLVMGNHVVRRGA